MDRDYLFRPADLSDVEAILEMQEVYYGEDGYPFDSGVARRTIVDQASCNSCHFVRSAHGGQRQTIDYCAMCHNPRNVNDERTSMFESPFEKTPESVQLAVMIHRIHKGKEPIPVGSTPSPRPLFELGVSRDFRAAPTANPPRVEGEAETVAFDHEFPGDLGDCQHAR